MDKVQYDYLQKIALEKQERNRKVLMYGCLPLAAFMSFSFFMVILFSGESGDETTVKDQSQTIEANELQVTPDENKIDRPPLAIVQDTEVFRKRFNKLMKSTDYAFTIDHIKVQEGEVNNTFEFQFGDNIAFVGTVNKRDNSVSSIVMIAQGDGTMASGADMVMCMAGLIAAVAPGLSAAERGNLLKELGLMQGELSANTTSRVTRNGIRYFLSTSDMVGVMFGAESIRNM